MSISRIIKEKIIKVQNEREDIVENIFELLRKQRGNMKPKRLLDVGCCSGELTLAIARFFNIDENNTNGVEFSEDYLKKCEDKFFARKIDLETTKLPFPDDNFDLVICNQVLEHLKNYNDVLNEIVRVTYKKGYILIGIPNLAHLINRIYLAIGIQPMCIGIDSSHVRGFTHKAFIKKLRRNQEMKLISYTGSVMYPLPYFLAKRISKHFLNLTGYTCYLLQKSDCKQ